MVHETTNNQRNTAIMKIKFALLAAALTASTALATTEPAPDFSTLPALSRERLSGSLTLGASTNYAASRGYVVTRAACGGDGTVFGALKLDYDLGKKKDYWSLENTIFYQIPVAGHNLYGNAVLMNGLQAYTPTPVGPADAHGSVRIGQKNIENEFSIITGAKYKRDKWNVRFGHQLIHGGLLGAMAKHFRKQGSSTTNELYIAPEWTPTAWFAAGVTTRLSFSGLYGWWFEPYMTFKAPLIGTENGILSNASQDLKLAAIATISMSATTEYFNEGDFACSNGSQAFWIKLSTPWFAKDNLIVTPAVSFNWAGPGALKANEKSHLRKYGYAPFKNFAVVGSLSATYTF